MEEPVRVLLVEDVSTDAELEVRELKRAGLRVLDRVVESETTFRDALQEFAPDVILSDFSMPGFDGMAALAIAKLHRPEVPFIFVSGTLGEEHAVRALKNGAVDYVLKHNLIRLPSAVERAVREARMREARERAEADRDAARERLASILATLRDALWSIDPGSEKMLYASPAMEAIYGIEASALVEDSGLRLRTVHPDDRARVLGQWEGLSAGGAFDSEYRIVRPDGSVRWIQDRGQWVGSGALSRIDGIARDITEQAEQRLRIARLSNIRDVLGAVNNAIVRIHDREELLDEACRIAVEVGGLQLASIALLDPQTGQMRVVAARSKDDSPDGAGKRALDAENAQGLIAETRQAGDVVVHNDIGEGAEREPRNLYGPGVRSASGFPLVVDEALHGVFALHSGETGYFDHEEVRLLKEVTGNISFALSLISKQERLNYLAYYDPLTGLPNRAFFRSMLGETLENAAKHRHLVAVIALDVARFKTVNDTFGQQGGDLLLRHIGQRLKSAAGEEGHVARLSADQFAMLVPLSTDGSHLTRVVLERAAALMREPFHIEGRELRISVRAGIAVFPGDGADADTLFRNAEAALKKARSTGERFTFYAPEMNARFAERLELENRLRRAVETRQLTLFYQPKVDAEGRQLVAFEALMRWTDPEDGLMLPGRFIPILEDTGLIAEAGRWAMQEAVSTQAHWRSRGWKPPRIAVNVSAKQLGQTGFVDEVRGILDGVPREERGLDIEITESLLLENISGAIDKLKEIRGMGVEVAIDDFGTGYSSLAYINKLPIHLLKIDRSFVTEMVREGESSSIISAIIALARGLKLKVVAEGVETEEQARLLQVLRCDQLQGFLTGAPMSREDIERIFFSAPMRSKV